MPGVDGPCVASRNGYERLIIIGDCGYYALAAEAFAKSLSCWGKASWQPHPEGCFASYRVPRFYSPSLQLSIILSLGTTQLISDPNPERNLSTQLGEDTSVVYLTADSRGWYKEEALEAVETEYSPLLQRSWNGKSWHFNLNEDGATAGRISMLDLVSIVNLSLQSHAVVDMNNFSLYKVIDRLLECSSGSTAYTVGLWLGHKMLEMHPPGEEDDIHQWIFTHASMLSDFASEMANDATRNCPHGKDCIVQRLSSYFEFMEDVVLLKIKNELEVESLDEDELFHLFAAIIGNPARDGEPVPRNYTEFKQLVALRVQDTCLSLLEVAEKSRASIGDGLLPLGNAYVEMYAQLNARVNHNILSNVKASHAIDGSKFCLFDCRFVPGFGLGVSLGDTIWTSCNHYMWISATLRRFSEIMQENKWMGRAAYHLECTELFSFTPFLQELGVPVIDGINSVILASRVTDAPVRFVNFKQSDQQEPPTPSALVADVIPTDCDEVLGARYFRDENLTVRSPTQDSRLYAFGAKGHGKLLHDEKLRWSTVNLAHPRFGDFELEFGFESYRTAAPADSIYPAGSALDIKRYVEHDSEKRPSLWYSVEKHHKGGGEVQYAVTEFDCYDSFFCRGIYHDKPKPAAEDAA